LGRGGNEVEAQATITSQDRIPAGKKNKVQKKREKNGEYYILDDDTERRNGRSSDDSVDIVLEEKRWAERELKEKY